ncbi:MAG: 1,2-epoxyphenylacetyl-CoA isomerase [Pseudomonadota bacterium]
MSTHQIRYEVSEHIATITLDRPEVMNAFGGTMREDLLARLEEAATDPGVRCLIITGAGKAFCAGGDVASMAELQARDDTTVLTTRMRAAARLISFLREIPKPVIAAVNGAAAGAGMNLALACDLRYAAASAKFSEAFIRIGLVPDWGGHFLLTELVGPARALELIMSGDRIDARDAERLGIVNACFSDEDFTTEVRKKARMFAAAPAAAIAAIKQGVRRALRGSLEDTLQYEMEAQERVFLSADAREGMRAFLEKRAPRFGPQS